MASLNLLQRIETFLQKDLRHERLSPQNSLKRKELLESLKKAISAETECQKLDDFLSQERRRSHTGEYNRNNIPLPKTPATSPIIKEDGNSSTVQEEDLYMDLNEPNATNIASPQHSGGSGSGYESYASDEETNARTKAEKEEESIAKYYVGTNCDVWSQIFLENKTFLSGKKWLKKVGIVKENHFQCYKKVGDAHPELDLPMHAYNVYLSNKEGTKSMIVSLEGTGSDGTGYRFYVTQKYAQDWNRVLHDKAAQVVRSGSLPSPPVANRPPSTFPSSEKPMQRQSSLIGVTDLGKGFKTAVADIFKKDKTRKKISVAEQMGANLCGNLNVCSEGRWSKKLCMIRDNELQVYGKDEAPDQVVPLHGCDLQPDFDNSERRFTFKITKKKTELLLLEASSSSEMGKWVGTLIAETGCAELPEAEENIYVEPDEYNSFLNTAKQTLKQTIKMKNTHKEDAEAVDSIYVDFNDSINFDEVSVATTSTGSDVSNKHNSLDRDKIPIPKERVKKKKAAKGGTANNNAAAQKAEKHKKKKDKTKHIEIDGPKQKDARTEQGLNDTDKIDKTKQRKEEINNSMKTLNIKILELRKYIDASSVATGREKIERAIKEAEKENKKLQHELSALENPSKDIETTTEKKHDSDVPRECGSPASISPPPRRYPAKQLPPQRARTSSNNTLPTPSGNVLSRMKMFENLDSKN